jgi:lysophospholipase L1-like esterase
MLLVITLLMDSFLVRASAQTSTEPRPFEMLVLGDSVVWGQGLTEENKFYTKVKNAIERELMGNRKVRQLVQAHSGATIAPKKPKSCPTAPGEVPIASPTLFSQVDMALATYASFGVKREEVDLVLVNGCINDVGLPGIANPFTSEKTITKQSAKFCKAGMESLLLRVRDRFPNAVIVVTGFFPIISKATDPDIMNKLLEAFFGGSQTRKIMNKATKEQQKELRAKGFEALRDQPPWLVRRLALLSNHWKSVSDNDLQAAVDAINTNSTGPKTYLARVVFADEECYAAKETHLWKITGSGGGFGNLTTDDEMFAPRQETCRLAAADLKGFGKLICPAAGTGHPNVKGAEKYAAAIMQQLRSASVFGRR